MIFYQKYINTHERESQIYDNYNLKRIDKWYPEIIYKNEKGIFNNTQKEEIINNLKERNNVYINKLIFSKHNNQSNNIGNIRIFIDCDAPPLPNKYFIDKFIRIHFSYFIKENDVLCESEIYDSLNNIEHYISGRGLSDQIHSDLIDK